MSQPNLFDDEPDLAIRISPHMAIMHQVFGRDDTHTCGACVQFEHVSRSRTSTTARCRLMQRSTDWAAKWPACGKFIPGSQHD